MLLFWNPRLARAFNITKARGQVATKYQVIFFNAEAKKAIASLSKELENAYEEAEKHLNSDQLISQNESTQENSNKRKSQTQLSQPPSKILKNQSEIYNIK